METLLEPFTYGYMINAIWVSALVGGVCAFLSAYLMLKGWSLIGDALSHAIVPGVAGAYMLGLPFAFGAFLSGGLAALAMLFLRQRTGAARIGRLQVAVDELHLDPVGGLAVHRDIGFDPLPERFPERAGEGPRERADHADLHGLGKGRQACQSSDERGCQ